MQKYSLLSSFILIILLSTGLNQNSLAQVTVNDLNTIQKEFSQNEVHIRPHTKTKFYQAINPFYWMYKGSLRAYQKVLSPQLASSCIYEVSCSRFSDKLVSEYGIIKGGFLSLDRITRCNRAYYAEASPLRKNAEGKIVESVKDFGRKND